MSGRDARKRVVIPDWLYSDAALDLAVLEDIMRDDLLPHNRRAAQRGIASIRRLQKGFNAAMIEELPAPKRERADDDELARVRTPRKSRR